METAQILLVEDNAGDIGLVRKALERAQIPHQLHVTRNGEEALRFMRREESFLIAPQPDIVLLDLNLPRMDGREVLREIRSDVALAATPVVVMTSSTAHSDVMDSYRLHANSVVTKPQTLQELQRLLTDLHHYWFGVVRLPGRIG